MSTFSVPVVRISSIVNHPDADRLTIVKVLGYTCISNKKEDGSWRYKEGDLAVYIPSASVLPEWLIKDLDMWDYEKNKGFLNGANGDRIGPKRLRGIFSEGMLLKVETDYPSGLPYGQGMVRNNNNEEMFVNEGDDVAEHLGITKWEPIIPAAMSGEVFNVGSFNASPVKYDIESYENYPDVFVNGEQVDVFEKIHGTFTGIAIVSGFTHSAAFESVPNERNVLIYSKGLGASGLCFKDVENNKNNLYVRAFRSMTDVQKFHLNRLANEYGGIHVLGESFGAGVQDLHYGQKVPTFRAFDVYLGKYPTGRFADSHEVDQILEILEIPRVPILAKGIPFDYNTIIALRDGKDTISNSNVREGVVIRTIWELNHIKLGRMQLKFVSPDYKLRKGKNITELN